MSDTGIRLTVKIDTSRTPEQQGEECRRAYEETCAAGGRSAPAGATP
jgi:hypothetical protein